MFSSEELSAVTAELKKAKRIVCMCHSNPDGDALGSLLGISLLLEKQYPEKEVVIVCKDPAPESFSYLPAVHLIVHEPKLREGDLLVFTDCAVPKQTGFHESHPQLFDGSYPSLSFDHHISNSNFAGLNIVRGDSCSACSIILALAEKMEWSVSPDIATCLLTGIETDTGGLLHSNTTSSVYRDCSKLLRLGARHQDIVQSVFRRANLSTLRLWGRVLEKIDLTESGGAISAVTQGDFRATGADYSELTGAIDYVNAIPGMRFSLILSERDGVVKGSMRTLREDVDVSAMAGTFDGGGHKKAAGFTLPGKLKAETRWKVVEE